MEYIFWISVGCIIFAYAGYPVITILISLVRTKPVQKGDFEPDVSMIIAAYNEELDIERKLINTLELDYPKHKLEVIVASDGSTDRTDQIVRTFAARANGIRVRLHRVEGRLGKTAAQNSAVKIASGEIIVFSDSASMYDKAAVRELARNYADPTVGAVSGMYKYINKKGASVGAATIMFWNYENFIKQTQTKIRTITGCCGCIYSVRKELYTELPPTIISDLVEPLTIIRKGYRIAFEPRAIAYEETTERLGQEFNMRVRVIVRGMNGLLFMRTLLNPVKYPFVSFQLYSHKVFRWLVPIFCAVAFVSNIYLLGKGPLYQALFLMQGIFYLAAGVGIVLEKQGIRVKALQLPMYFAVVNAASLVSILKVLRGENIIIWQTER